MRSMTVRAAVALAVAPAACQAEPHICAHLCSDVYALLYRVDDASAGQSRHETRDSCMQAAAGKP